jgi:hypothetical protein
MTAWSRATCGRCGGGIGANNPLFTSFPRPEVSWISFVGCEICGVLRCLRCEEGSGHCDEPWIHERFPSVWLNRYRSMLWVRSWCLACREPTRPTPKGSGIRPDPSLAAEARWYACASCAYEFCEACAQRRRERCACGEKAELRAVPPYFAYLPENLRLKIRSLAPDLRASALLDERRKFVASWERGALTAFQTDSFTWALDGALRDLDVDPGFSPWRE